MTTAPYTASFSSNAPAATAIYSLALRNALPISAALEGAVETGAEGPDAELTVQTCALPIRSEEHTSELQSHLNLVCRLLLEKKKRLLTHTRRGRIGTARAPT